MTQRLYDKHDAAVAYRLHKAIDVECDAGVFWGVTLCAVYENNTIEFCDDAGKIHRVSLLMDEVFVAGA